MKFTSINKTFSPDPVTRTLFKYKFKKAANKSHMQGYFMFNGKYKLIIESFQTKFQIEITLNNKKLNDNSKCFFSIGTY